MSAGGLKNGLFDFNLSQTAMLDGGTGGDATAGDGTYTGVLGADCCAELGARNVRVKAEVKDSSNRRHATAVEFGGLTVVAK